VDPLTGNNFAVDKVFDFYAGLDAAADGRATNIDGGAVQMQPSAQDELLGLDERSRIDLPPGAFGEGSDSLADAGVVAQTTTTVNVSMTKGRDQTLAKALSIAAVGYAPAALEVADVPSAFPGEMWAAMSKYRTLASTTTVGGANPLSAFYSIFLPAGIRHQLKQRADLTLSYSLAASTATNTDQIQVWFYNAVLGRFVLENTNRRLDTVNKTVTVSVDHFSTFVVLGSTPVLTIGATFGGDQIAVANFPNPADCIPHANLAINSTLFGVGGVHGTFTGTMIRTSIPNGDTSVLKINIYTVTGEKVRTIDQGEVAAGKTYYTPWNCTNDSGRAVASGVYIGEVVHNKRHKFFKIAIIKGSGL
ncbi:MAG: FlgD immunoglobulin-like domain containing protein, partial [Elusimicrobiota bacterium]